MDSERKMISMFVGVVFFLMYTGMCKGQVTVQFVQTYVFVSEGEELQLQIKRNGPINEILNVIVRVDNQNQDFVGSSQVGTFIPGGPDVVSVTFTVTNDSQPEIEEAYIFELSVIGNSASLTAPTVATVTIYANDDAYGVFTFLDSSPMKVREDAMFTRIVNIGIGRSQGSFGQVTVTYVINGSNLEAQPWNDIAPATGSILFQPMETQNFLQLQIRDDQIPENDEEFSIILTGATQGARVESRLFTVIILANDAPIRFQQAEFRFDEGPMTKTVSITVYRGLALDGSTRIGGIDSSAFANFFFLSNTAVSGQDFQGQNGQDNGRISFAPGQTVASINFDIVDDSEPEMAESFQVLLSSPTGDVILSSPSQATIIINANDEPNGVLSFRSPDFISSPIRKVNEENPQSIIFDVIRTGGSFGIITVEWEILHNDTAVGNVSLDLTPIRGSLTFQSGQKETQLITSVVSDTVPEPTERFIVRLLAETVQGGAKVEGITWGIILVEDSDNFYGIVEFAPQNEQKILTTSFPRILQLTVSRTGGTAGTLSINITVTYQQSGVVVTGVLEQTELVVVMYNAQNLATVQVQLLTSAFLQIGGAFVATLTGVSLAQEAPNGAYNSPKIGTNFVVKVPVTTAEANGEIGFQESTDVVVDEPDQAAKRVDLVLTREGTSGRAVISWTLSGVGPSASEVTAGDVGEMAGTVVMESGMSQTTISLNIMPDSIPELNETILVNLTKVEPADTQRLKGGTSLRRVVIRENDDPGGTFQFAATMMTSYVLQEGGLPVELIVERTGGDLVTKSLKYEITPGGDKEFYGATNVIKFSPGIRVRNLTVLAIADGIPELEEIFTVSLLPYDSPVNIGPRAGIFLTISQNDDPYGIIQFQIAGLRVFLNESRDGKLETASIPLERLKGAFGTVQVSWTTEPGDGLDLRPSSGTVTFQPDQKIAFINVESIDDKISEPAETFRILLSSPLGGTTIGNRSEAIVTINANDYPVYFKKYNYTVDEPAQVAVTIMRDGPTNQEVRVKYRTVDGTASAAGFDFENVIVGELVMVATEIEKNITVRVLDDEIAEGNETFYIQLYSFSGDIVLQGPNNCSITILANDYAYGIFKFGAPYSLSVEEGSTATFYINRAGGNYGTVKVFWQIYIILTNEVENAGEFTVRGNQSVIFGPEEVGKPIFITPRIDDVPENDKSYYVRLDTVQVLEGRTDIPMARIADTDTQVLLTILASNDPNGRFGFPALVKEQSVAEDFYPGMDSTTRVKYNVERRQGIFGAVAVSWEIFSGVVAGGMPQMFDLIFLGDIPSGVTLVPSKQRPQTGTNVVFMDGFQGHYISVASRYHPIAADIPDGFSIGGWVQPFSNTSGYILAKTNRDGSRHFYTLKLVTSDFTTQLVFGYSLTGSNDNLFFFKSVDKNIQDAKWHHVLVTSNSTMVQFYLDGQLIEHRSLPEGQSIIDSDGQLTVGGITPGKDYFVGYLQDVCIYSRKLEESEIQEVYQTPAAKDVTPISGFLTYMEGARAGEFTLSSIQDTEAEGNEIFTIKLISAKGGATLSANDSTATLTVLKSDSANGLFGFQQPCQPGRSNTENFTVSCIVDRSRGNDGTVIVTWVIYQLVDGLAIIATDDFVNYTGSTVFGAGQRTQTFTLAAKLDLIPELSETYEIRLVNATTDDGVIGSTNGSSAGVDPTNSRSTVIIEENDYPYGMLQFSTAEFPPQPYDPIIPPATEAPTVRVAEEAGKVRLLVVRAQGSIGAVTVEWRTTDGTARSSGKTPPDYSAGVGRLSFANGQRYAYIEITIIDNNLPEDDKFFTISLLNPGGGVTLGLGSIVTVVIKSSDGAYGIFQFADTSLGVQAEETGDSGYNLVNLQVVRLGGMIGAVDITWQLLGNQVSDIVDNNGTVSFASGQTTAFLGIKVRGDTAPELDEVFQIKLISTTRGELGNPAKLTSEITILANDEIYGVFVIPDTQRPRRVEEKLQDVTVTVQRLFGTFGTVDVNVSTLLPNETYFFIPQTFQRADRNDYVVSSEVIRFAPGQSIGTFTVQILEDDIPEPDEAVYIRVVGVSLIELAQIRPVTNSPRIGPESDSYGLIVISSNDNANGFLELSPSSPVVPESTNETFLYVVRTGGSYGEVTVTFSIQDGTARVGEDYLVLASQVVLLDGEKSKPVPIRIIDDYIPEQAETFAVQLLNLITGGAVLGSTVSATVLIEASDDPNGAFEFSVNGQSVLEPEGGNPTMIQITVFRTGGTQGIAVVDWEARLDGQLALYDVSPTNGSLYYVSNEASRNISISILPDDIPESTEDIKITLLRTTQGRIGNRNVFTLTIPSNDNPHGVVQLSASVYTVEETPSNSVQDIGLIRIGGSFGQLRVYYNTESYNAVADPGQIPGKARDYFLEPQFGSRGIEGIQVVVPEGQEPIEVCARECLTQTTCMAFEVYISGTRGTCKWYTTVTAQPLISTSSIQYFIKNQAKASTLMGNRATPGDDFNVVTNGYIIMNEGITVASVPVTILADIIPELDEVFVVRLTKVEVVGETPGPANSAYLGELRNATVTILKNDDAYGMFRIYSNSPLAEENGQVLPVEEKPQLAVNMVVDREGGSIGEVSVRWSVNTSMSTAVYGKDFVADGATLTFVPGETRKLVTVTVMDDTEPEDNETITIQLTNPTGGADIRNGIAKILILENDNVAGIVAFSTTSFLAREGDNVTVSVTRTIPARGSVSVNWNIQGLNNANPAVNFNSYQGTLYFSEGDLIKMLTVKVLEDNIPEVNEEYQIQLTNVRTTGVGPTGAATINPQFQTASITIEGSNDPHGVVQFSTNSVNIRVDEGNRTVNIQVDRKFGAIGTVRVEYEIVSGSISVLSGDLQQATPSQDFVALKSYIDLGDGVVAGPISIQILEDNIPEVDEVFIIRLTQVSLLTTGSPPPRLASTGIVSQVIINANDGTKGIVKFAPDSAVVSVDEVSKNISLTLLRDMGTFGDVSIFFYAQSVVDGTNLGLDYRITPEELLFVNGESQKVILVEIMNDDLPEPDETFEVILSNPTNGLVLGSPSRASVTILANDVPGGIVRLESDAVLTLEEPGGDSSNMSSVNIVVMRGPGIYGLLNVPFEIIPELVENRNDISPMQGSVTFKDRQTIATLTLQVLGDTNPEDAERFTLRLLDPVASAKLGTPVQRILVIAPNDSPNGLISLYAAGTRLREISVEEGVGMIQFDVVRSQGVEGQASLDVATEPGTATIAADINQVMLAPIQVLTARDIGGWYTFSVNSTTYFLMLESSVVGELVTRPGSNGSTIPVDLNNLSQTTLFRWQGELTPVQTLETDGVEAAQSFTIDGVTYLIVLNSGNFNRYQTNSRLYRVTSSGILLVLQDIPTKGARNAAFISQNGGYYLIIANALDNSGNSRVNTEIYKWDVNSSLFNSLPWQSLATLGAESVVVFEVEGAKYLAVANSYDSVDKSYQLESVVYKLGANSEFSQHQRIATMGCRAIRFLQIQSLNLLIFANNRDNTVSSPQNSLVYRWDTMTQSFILHQRLETNRAEDVTVFTAYDDTVHLAFANGIGNSVIFVWDVQQNQFKPVWTGPPTRNLHPVRIQQTAANIDLIAVAEKNITANVTIYQVIKVKDSDFAPRTVTMIFDPGQTLLHTTAMVLQDTTPEDTETFYVTLRNPKGGVEIGPNSRIAINILSNDNAHGIIEIAPDSLDIRAMELPGRDNTIQINVLRSQGFFGLVSVRWVATGDHDGTNDIFPLEGKVEFATGQSVATISLTIRNDDLAELAEVTYIQLTEVMDSGTDLAGRGAQIGVNKTAKVTVLANDSPYGVVSWEKTLLTVQEPEGTDSMETLFIVREQGMRGDLQVMFQTSVNAMAPTEQQAISGEDYIARLGTVVIQENVIRVPIDIVIRQDSIPETTETFLINITSVILLGQTPPPGSEPSVKIPGNVVTVTIPENDNARGIVQFNVTTNIEGRIDTYEEYGKNTTLSLQVSRSVGLFGPVTITWQAEPREATILDFAPSSGTLRLANTEQSANIYITIIDDTIPEEMETFDIRLIGISGGALLGPYSSVRIAILKNDSPNGLFRFVTTEAVLRESTSLYDPNGETQLIIERIQGTDGVVNVQWRLNAEAIYDFYEPYSGSLPFAQGEKTKSLTLRTRPDNILEGEEIFIVSLISADNNADISPSQGDARVRILPDPGASGTVSILTESRNVYIGEPGESNPNYNGKVQIALTRGQGIYGEITTSWSIVPRDISAFVQVEGIIHFVDLQQTATIIVQALDDTVPELRMTYTLQLVSVTNGAFISKDPGADTSYIIFVASDYPHGMFVFDLPQIMSISEDIYSVSIPVIRRSGLNGQVLLSYKTYPGTATQYEDYFPVESTLTFQHGENRQFVNIQIIQDTLPEGPEEFYVNLTSSRLLVPSDNNYTVVNGLQLDMKPVIGSLDMKIVVIDKNDNAEGTIQFSSIAVNFLVSEEDGVAQIPLLRTGGTYSTVTVLYETRNMTALANMDYVVLSGQVMFPDGMKQTTINITIRDDTEMEFQEQFLVILTGILGGSLLGPLTTSTVTIAKSDYPNGKFGFKGQLEVFIDNPSSMRQQIFTVERTGGIQGQQTVYWQMLGPNNPGGVLEVTNDIAYLVNGQEVTKGTLLWEDGQAGEKTFTLNIKPFSSWEIEKMFIIQLYKIQGFPSNVGDGEVGPTTGNVTLTISKFGHPNGIVRFDGLALSEREVDEPDGTATLSLTFPLIRRPDTGTVGNIEILWRIEGPQDEIPDVQPRNGSAMIADAERNGNIVIQILPDDVPELTEPFQLVLTRIIGGAELDTQNVISLFRIRFNDQPHGLFGIIPQYQTVLVDPAELTRFLRVNFTRHAGTFGSVILTFSLQYDIPQSGILLALNGGTVTFQSGQANRVVDILIEGTGFLEIGTTFSLSLIEVQYLGSGVTDPPKFQAGETEAKVVVPAVAANSKVGFLALVASVDEASRTSILTVLRQGTYGTLEVPWQSGFPNGQRPAGFREGAISSNSGVVTIPHSVEMKNFTVELIATLNGSELFAVNLPVPPSTTVPGGSRLISDKRVVRIEPHGVLRFADNSTNPRISELFGKVYLRVIRLYGSENKIEARYRAYGMTADPGDDFVTTENQAIVMEPGEISATIMIDVVQDNKPEKQEIFFVNLTDVEKFPTDTSPSISPRLSSLYAASVVIIEESNDPYGILEIVPRTVEVEEQYQTVNFTILRTGGIFGMVSVLVRTVGGGESWTSQIVPKPGATGNDTITEILGNRDRFTSATGGQDYEVLDTKLTFKDGETSKNVMVTILADGMPEPDETIIVYLTQPVGGARIAIGEPDGGKKGFSVIKVYQNDLSNGIIGFSEDSKLVVVNEDLAPTFTLKLARFEAIFGEVEVSWVAKVSEASAETQDVVLADQLERTAGSAICPAQQANCFFNVTLKNDDIPEESHSFLIKLVSVQRDAKLNNQSLYVTVTVLASDYIRGLIGFTEDSRVVIFGHRDTSVRLKVNRLQGQDYKVEVNFQTLQMITQNTVFGVNVYPALEGEDYSGQSGTLVFLPGRQDLQYIDINLTPLKASSNPYPKQFYVLLKNPTNGASLNQTSLQAVVRIVQQEDKEMWNIIKPEGGNQTDKELQQTITKLDTTLQPQNSLNNDKVTLIENILDSITEKGLNKKLPPETIAQILNILCKMLTPDKNDATQGRFSLASRMENLAYMMVTETSCPTPTPPDMKSLQCPYAKISAGRWPLSKIQGFEYQAQRQDEFVIPSTVPNVPVPVDNCVDFHMIEYTSEQWFMRSGEKQLLSSKIISFGIKGRPSSYTEDPVKFRIHTPDRRIATRQAQCVYFDTSLKNWIGPQEVCKVTNDLGLGSDDYVDCSCKHLTNYAVKATTTDTGLVGYLVWFYISCFICMSGLALAVLAHYACSMNPMLSASLLIHMCFACMATEICYVIAAFLSPTEILVYTLSQNNYRCTVMGLFFHYFFLAQFTWMMTQAVNLWKILVMNDEHTDRKYVLFFLLGWGLPGVILAVFYVVTYNVYKYVYSMPYDFVYGDVNNNGDMCFITNPYAALGGIIGPVLLLLVVVGVVFVKAFQVTAQWQAYDDIYRGRYNIHEVRILLLFWAVIVLTWLWGGLHLAYGQLWMLIMFCIFNIIMGLMALVLYALLRNPCVYQCLAPRQVSTYAVNGTLLHHNLRHGVEQYQFHPSTLDIASLKGSKASLLNESWERDSVPSHSTMKVKRTLPAHANIYITPPVLHQNLDDSDTKDFDDLLYALKTGGSFTPSDESFDSDKLSYISNKMDIYELKRIDIADTHI